MKAFVNGQHIIFLSRGIFTLLVCIGVVSVTNGQANRIGLNPPLVQTQPTEPTFTDTNESQVNVVDVKIEGASYIPADEYIRRLKTRINRAYDPDDVQSDVEELQPFENRAECPILHQKNSTGHHRHLPGL